MNYTPNHMLPQWSEKDPIRMYDFNQMSRDLEFGLDTAVTAAVAAQSSADAAQSTADSALSKAKAAYSPDKPPYAAGSYTGKGTSRAIELGFMPSFLIISGMQASYAQEDLSPFDRYFAIVGSTGTSSGQQMQHRVQLTQTGFTVYKAANQGSYLPLLNETDRKYYYIAFR